jgi:hypothetical protein
MAVSYAGELARWNIETTIIVPGAFTSGTNHFANAGKPDDGNRGCRVKKWPLPNKSIHDPTANQSTCPLRSGSG